MTAPLLGEPSPKRKSASHGEAGYARNARDAYFTEPWVTRALLKAADLSLPPSWSLADCLVWEPACGDGRMAAEIAKTGHPVLCSDIHDYGFPGTAILDFIRDPAPAEWASPTGVAAAIVTNPPFDLAPDFIHRGLALTQPNRGKVAILQRHEFDAPRANWPLFQPPFAAKLILHKRPRWSTEDKASPRFPYAWYLWDWRHRGDPIIRWLGDPDGPAGQGALL